MFLPLSFILLVLCGKTGSGKTSLLHQLELSGFPVIDLEKIAGHKGSAFGGLLLPPQPSQKDFEKDLQNELHHLLNFPFVFIEQKPGSIGKRKIPEWLISKINEGIIIQLHVSKQLRTENLSKQYAPAGKDKFKDALHKISGRLPASILKQCITLLDEGNFTDFIKMMLDYYDHSLKYTLTKPPDIIIPVQTADTFFTMQQLLDALKKNGINVM